MMYDGGIVSFKAGKVARILIHYLLNGKVAVSTSEVQLKIHFRSDKVNTPGQARAFQRATAIRANGEEVRALGSQS
jgi:hypothetical protein